MSPPPFLIPTINYSTLNVNTFQGEFGLNINDLSTISIIWYDMDEMRQVAVLGSTGSIGRQTLEVVRALSHQFQVVALAGEKNIDLLAKQVNEFKPRLVYSQDKMALARLTNTEYEFLALEDITRHPEVDAVVIATSGRSGLSPTLAAARAGKNIALANKESLVMAGEIDKAEVESKRRDIN